MAVNQAFNNRFNKFQRQSKKKFIPVRVTDIILDADHPAFEEYGHYDSIGTIFFSRIEDQLENESTENANIARPLFSYLKHYPLINEVVLILTTTDKGIYNNEFDSTYYLPSVNVWNHPHHNALPEIRNLKQEATENDYSESESGIVRQIKDGGTDIDLGQYFNEKSKLKPLMPFEGDFLLEGRFGSSIRFGSTTPIGTSPWSLTSQEENMGDPITVIRNGQSTDITTEESWIHTVEDINNDLASIYLTSNQRFDELKTAGVITADKFTISWPSFGVSDPITTREPEIPETNTEELTQEVEELCTKPEPTVVKHGKIGLQRTLWSDKMPVEPINIDSYIKDEPEIYDYTKRNLVNALRN